MIQPARASSVSALPADGVLIFARASFRLLRPEGGVVVFHDYGGEWPGVTQALNELWQRGDRYKGLRHIKGTSLAYSEVGGSWLNRSGHP